MNHMTYRIAICKTNKLYKRPAFCRAGKPAAHKKGNTLSPCPAAPRRRRNSRSFPLGRIRQHFASWRPREPRGMDSLPDRSATKFPCSARDFQGTERPLRVLLLLFAQAKRRPCRRRGGKSGNYEECKEGGAGGPAGLMRSYRFFSSPVASLNSLISSSSSLACAWTASQVPSVSYHSALSSWTSLACCSTQV